MFTSSAIAEALRVRIEPELFLLNNFFGQERFFQGRFLIVDSRRAKRVLSPVVSRYHPGVVVERPVVQTTADDVPKLAPFRVTTLGQLDFRAPGEIGTDANAATTFAELLRDDTADLADIIGRRTELFASQILFNGKIRYRLDGGEYEEFGFGPQVPTVYNPPTPWDNALAKPLDDLKRVRSQIIRDTGFAPDIVVFSHASADLFTNNEQVLDQLNKLHFIAGRVEPTRPTGTAQWLGRLLLPALEMWAYSDEYIDEEDGQSTAPMIPEHACVVGTTNPSGFAYWGSILQLEEGGYTESERLKLIPRMMYDLPNETAQYRLQSRPCLVPFDAASWTVINCVPPTTRRKAAPAIPAEASQPPNPRKARAMPFADVPIQTLSPANLIADPAYPLLSETIPIDEPLFLGSIISMTELNALVYVSCFSESVKSRWMARPLAYM
jgi:hypothetical protein